MKIKKTSRGFHIAEFKDINGIDCTIQKSSNAEKDCIWLGANQTCTMIFDAIKFRRSRTHGYRRANPTIDKDLDGNPVKENYCVIVKIKDCKIETDITGRRYYNPNGVQSIPMNHSLTNMGRYKSTFQNVGTINECRKNYYYLVYDGCVFKGVSTIYTRDLP